MHTMKLLVLLASICLAMQPIIAEEVNSLFHNISKRTPNKNCGKTVSECMKSNSQLVKSCKVCGLINTGDKPIIISGNTVYPQHRYPWMVALLASGKDFCGGSIISDSYILTAAHCVDNKTNINIGFLSPTSRFTSGYPIERAIIHPKYKTGKRVYFDFGLIKLKEKITCDEYKTPICLPPATTSLPLKTVLTIAGWGRFIKDQEDHPEQLLQADVYVVDLKECRRTSNEIYCLRSKTPGQSSCYGDSGGPLIYKQKNKNFCVGVSSFNFKNCDTNLPFGYANVAVAMDWITQVTGVKPENF